MKFYIASSLQNKEKVNFVSKLLQEKGHQHTYDWTKNSKAISFESLKSIGEKEREGVEEADMLIALLPGGKGTHVEIGLAIGMKKPVYIYNENELVDPSSSCTFYHIDGVSMFSGSMINFLQEIEREIKG